MSKLALAVGIAAWLGLFVAATVFAQPTGERYLAYGGGINAGTHSIQVTDVFLPPTDVTALYPLGTLSPVRVNGSPLVDPTAYLTWRAVDEVWITVDRNETVTTEFGTAAWDVDRIAGLLAPARKNENIPPPVELNHYLCYAVTGPPVQVNVHLEDKQVSFDAATIAPALLCNPC